MPAEVRQDILYNFIVDATNFAGAVGGIIRGLDNLDKGMEKVGKNTSFLNRALSTFTGVVLRDLTRGALRAGQALLRLGGNFAQYIGDIEVVETRIKGIGENVHQIFIPAIRALVNVVGDALGWIERLFKDPSGEWTAGFLRLRATIQVFANWFLSIWERLTSGVGEASEGMMDRFVDAIVNGVRIAANALRRFATFMASIFGGAAPGAVTEAGIAATRPGARAPVSLAREAAPKAKKPPTLLKAPKEVSPVDPEDLRRMSFLSNLWAKATGKLAEATAAAAKARNFLAKAEERLEAAAEKVYNIRRKIERLELEWAEIPERFVRGRRRQLALELSAAQEAERERNKERKFAQERSQEAEKYRREQEKIANDLKRQIDTLVKSIERQAERYAVYLERMNEWAAENAARMAAWRKENEEAAAAAGKLDKLTADLDESMAKYVTELEGELLPLFADMELSAESLLGTVISLIAKATEFGKALREAIEGWLEKLRNVRDWWDDLPDWVQNLLKGATLVLGITWLAGALGLGGLTTGIIGALTAAGLALGPVGWILGMGVILAKVAGKEGREPQTERWLDIVKGTGPTEKETTQWWRDNVITPIYDFLTGGEGKDEIEEGARKGIKEPFLGVLTSMQHDAVGESIIPDMVNAILDWIRRLGDQLGEYLDQMAAKFRILEDSIKGLEPALADIRQFTSGGSIKVINISGPFNIGQGLSEGDVRNAIYDALYNVVTT